MKCSVLGPPEPPRLRAVLSSPNHRSVSVYIYITNEVPCKLVKQFSIFQRVLLFLQVSHLSDRQLCTFPFWRLDTRTGLNSRAPCVHWNIHTTQANLLFQVKKQNILLLPKVCLPINIKRKQGWNQLAKIWSQQRCLNLSITLYLYSNSSFKILPYYPFLPLCNL